MGLPHVPPKRSRADPPNSGRERVLVLVKALPHVGKRHGETVCCAGVTADGVWRRQYPVHYRRLKSEFRRWSWIEYDWTSPTGEDRRRESRRVQEASIRTVGEMPERERATFLETCIVPSCDVAAERGQSLALIRPIKSKFWWIRKTQKQIAKESEAYKRAASQLSFLDAELAALTPCPFAFKFNYQTSDGKSHRATCDDWETAAMYFNWEKRMGSSAALKAMEKTFNVTYPEKGMAFAIGTHSLYPNVWLLIGVIRLNFPIQPSFDI